MRNRARIASRPQPPFAPGVIEGPMRRRGHLVDLIAGRPGLLACALVLTGLAAALGWVLCLALGGR